MDDGNHDSRIPHSSLLLFRYPFPMTAPTQPTAILTFDMEFWYNSEFLRPILEKMDVKAMGDRMEEQLDMVLPTLQSTGATATFFILGSVAKRYPALVRRVAEAGHEIASHGYSHTTLDRLTPEEFRKELRRTNEVLQSACGRSAIGFRAPRFSLTPTSSWAIDILHEEGFTYDSSVFPSSITPHGSNRGPMEPYRIDASDIYKSSASTDAILELPIAAYPIGGLRVPVGGGIYFRALPSMISRRMLLSLARTQSPMLYFHTHEFDREVPKLLRDTDRSRLPSSMSARDRRSENSSGSFKTCAAFPWHSTFKPMPFALDLHGHSRHSYDSLLDPVAVIRRARRRGLNATAITDHGTIKGGLEARERNPFSDFFVIVGVEIRTEIGDVVGLFLEKEIVATSFDAVADEIHAQGGLVLLPHPGKLPVDLVMPHLSRIDMIEIWNARSKEKWNVSAERLGNQSGKPTVACSDAHSRFEIGRAYTILQIDDAKNLKRDLLTAPRTFVRGHTNFYLSHVASVLTERWKSRQS